MDVRDRGRSAPGETKPEVIVGIARIVRFAVAVLAAATILVIVLIACSAADFSLPARSAPGGNV